MTKLFIWKVMTYLNASSVWCNLILLKSRYFVCNCLLLLSFQHGGTTPESRQVFRTYDGIKRLTMAMYLTAKCQMYLWQLLWIFLTIPHHTEGKDQIFLLFLNVTLYMKKISAHCAWNSHFHTTCNRVFIPAYTINSSIGPKWVT